MLLHNLIQCCFVFLTKIYWLGWSNRYICTVFIHWRSAVYLFSNSNKSVLGYFDLINIFVQNENTLYSRWQNWCIDKKRHKLHPWGTMNIEWPGLQECWCTHQRNENSDRPWHDWMWMVLISCSLSADAVNKENMRIINTKVRAIT